MHLDEANSAAWHVGKRLLERAIRERLEFAFETTLGGSTIPGLLETAADARIAVRVWFVGLEGPALQEVPGWAKPIGAAVRRGSRTP